METITVTKDDLSFKKIFCYGGEGIVYHYKDKLLKIFNNPTLNQKNKIDILNKSKIKELLKPLCYVKKEISNDINFNGILMDNVECDKNKTIEKKVDSLNTLEEKIKLYKLQESIMRKIHQENMVLVDLNPENFLINKNGDMVLIDDVNFKMNEYENDINPVLFSNYYRNKVSNKITKDIDIISYILYLIYNLTDPKYRFSKKRMESYDYTNYIEDEIKKLNVSKEFIEKCLEIVSDSKNKPYLGNTIDLLKSNEKYIKRIG